MTIQATTGGNRQTIAVYQSNFKSRTLSSVGHIYRAIASNQALRDNTKAIQKKHQFAILVNFPNGKDEYQADKKKLASICFAGNVFRSGENEKYIDSGLMSWDLDDKSLIPDELREQRLFFNNLPFTDATGLSVSGFLSGAFWANIRIEIPHNEKRFKTLPQLVKSAMGYNQDDSYFDLCNKLRSVYFDVLTKIFSEKGIDIGKKGRSAKDTRYLTHDATLFVSNTSDKVTIQFLENQLKDNPKQSEKGTETKPLSPVHSSKIFGACHEYANTKGYPIGAGFYYHFTHFSIAANLYGISQEQTFNYLNNIHKIGSGNSVSYPYNKNKDSFGKWSYLIDDTQAETLTFNLQDDERVLDIDFDTGNCYTIAGTGTGKTHAFLHRPDKKVLAVPTNSQIAGIKEQYKDIDICTWNGGNKNIDQALNSDAIVTNYACLSGLTSELGEDAANYRLGIDEIHLCCTSGSSSYLYDNITEMLRVKSSFKSFEGMTATPVFTCNPALKELKKVHFVKDATPKKAQIVEYSGDRLLAAANLFNRSIDNNRTPIILFDNKSGQREKLATLLKKGYEFVSSEDLPEFLDNGNIPDNVCGMVCTSAFKQGNNIFNSAHFDFIFVGAFHWSDIVQLCGRGRNALSINAYILAKETRTKVNYSFNCLKYANEIIKEAEHQIKRHYTGLINTSLPAAKYEIRAKSWFSPFPVKYEDGKWKIDYVKVDYEVLKQEKAAQYENTEYLKKVLGPYGFNFLEDVLESSALNPEQKAASKETKAQFKEEQEQKYNNAIDLLEQQPDMQKHCVEMLPKSKGIEKLVFIRFLELSAFNQDSNTIIKTLRETGIKKAKFRLIIDQLKHIEYLKSEDCRDPYTPIAFFTNEAVELFTDQTFTKEQVRDKCLQALVSAGMKKEIEIITKMERNTHILKILKKMFSIQITKTWDKEGNKIRKYTFGALNLRELLNTRKIKAPEKKIPALK